MDTDTDLFPVLPITKAKILKISDRKYAYRTTFLAIRFQFQCFFQIFYTGLQQSFRGSFSLCKQYDVIGIANARHSSSLEFLVKLIQVDICQQRRKISALG
jgi:hypothetical protein